MRRKYYLHKRQNGIFYVEYVNPENGEKMSARSTRKRDEVDARVQAELWMEKGIPAAKSKIPRLIAEVAGLESIIKAIKKADLTSDDALRIVSTLKGIGLIDITAVANTGHGAVPFVQFLEAFWD
jgi:hypothetical protein